MTVYTRRDDPHLPERVETPQGYTVVHVPAGPPERLPKDELLAHMGPFAQYLDEQWSADRPDVAHAHFWMSGIATQLAARHLDLPAVQTFHALGVVKRRHQGVQDTSPQDRLKLEAMVAATATWVAATCTDEVFELMRLGRARSRISVVPCGVDLDLFTPDGPPRREAAPHRPVGRFVPRKGFDVVVRALPAIADTELVIVGGPDVAGLDADPEALDCISSPSNSGSPTGCTSSAPWPRGHACCCGRPTWWRTPWYEPFGIVPLEAMACGIPVVASAVGGMLDTIVHESPAGWCSPSVPARWPTRSTQLLRRRFRGKFRRSGTRRARARTPGTASPATPCDSTPARPGACDAGHRPN